MPAGAENELMMKNVLDYTVLPPLQLNLISINTTINSTFIKHRK